MPSSFSVKWVQSNISCVTATPPHTTCYVNILISRKDNDLWWIIVFNYAILPLLQIRWASVGQMRCSEQRTINHSISPPSWRKSDLTCFGWKEKIKSNFHYQDKVITPHQNVAYSNVWKSRSWMCLQHPLTALHVSVKFSVSDTHILLLLPFQEADTCTHAHTHADINSTPHLPWDVKSLLSHHMD